MDRSKEETLQIYTIMRESPPVSIFEMNYEDWDWVYVHFGYDDCYEAEKNEPTQSFSYTQDILVLTRQDIESIDFNVTKCETIGGRAKYSEESLQEWEYVRAVENCCNYIELRLHKYDDTYEKNAQENIRGIFNFLPKYKGFIKEICFIKTDENGEIENARLVCSIRFDRFAGKRPVVKFDESSTSFHVVQRFSFVPLGEDLIPSLFTPIGLYRMECEE